MGDEETIKKIPASELLTLGKEAQDVVQAWVNPEMTKGKIAEAQDLGVNLWNCQEHFPGISGHLREFFAWVAMGASLESMREYLTGEWVEWDLPLFIDA